MNKPPRKSIYRVEREEQLRDLESGWRDGTHGGWGKDDKMADDARRRLVEFRAAIGREMIANKRRHDQKDLSQLLADYISSRRGNR